jgi:hypothetical protein
MNFDHASFSRCHSLQGDLWAVSLNFISQPPAPGLETVPLTASSKPLIPVTSAVHLLYRESTLPGRTPRLPHGSIDCMLMTTALTKTLSVPLA